MLEQLNEQLMEIKQKKRQKAKWEQRLADFRKQLETEERKAQEQRKLAESGEVDVERLQGLTFSNLLHTILRDKKDRIGEEQLEALRARLKEEQALQSVAELREEIAELENRLKDVQNLDWVLKELRRKKIKWIEEHHYEICEDLYDLSERETHLNLVLKELEEAVHAGKLLRTALHAAADCLGSAKGWGGFDLLGGGVVATAAKHRRMEEARHHIHVAGRRLLQFEKELKDLSIHGKLGGELDLKGALQFADYFFDGLVVDWIVQGKMERSYQQVREKIHESDTFLHRLEERKTAVAAELQAVHNRYMQILDTAADEPAAGGQDKRDT